MFLKSFPVLPRLSYPDNNSNSEMYCNNQFVELESLAPLTMLSAKSTVEHVEVWELYEELDSLPIEIQKALVS